MFLMLSLPFSVFIFRSPGFKFNYFSRQDRWEAGGGFECSYRTSNCGSEELCEGVPCDVCEIEEDTCLSRSSQFNKRRWVRWGWSLNPTLPSSGWLAWYLPDFYPYTSLWGRLNWERDWSKIHMFALKGQANGKMEWVEDVEAFGKSEVTKLTDFKSLIWSSPVIGEPQRSAMFT